MFLTRSTTSVWGSASSHVHFDRRFTWDVASESESKVTLSITSKSGPEAQITGSRDVVCKTQADFKANKLNRNEQTKLESLRFRVLKEREITQRKFKQTERMMMAKSAKLAERIQKLESSSCIAERPMSFGYDKRPKSEPLSTWTKSVVLKTEEGSDPCRICERIQNIIRSYELEGKRTGIIEENVNHSTCMFSDRQVRTFVHMLENKYFSDLPKLSSKLKEIGLQSRKDNKKNDPRISREEINNSIARRNVELRIQQFCRELERYKKSHRGIPREVQDAVEKVRLENAVVRTRQPDTKKDFMTEVEQLLELR